MELINNSSKTLGDDLKNEIKAGSKLRIAATCFSIYAYAALKEELEQIDELKFLFTTPVDITEKISDNVKKEKKEFFIPKLSEMGICGTMKLSPPEYNVTKLRSDYEHMQNMLFGEKPRFEEIMNGIANLEKEINNYN